MLESQIVVFDACVFYPAPIRDLLLRLAQAELFRAKWTDQIHDEWINSLLKNRTDLTKEKLENTRNLINNAVRDCLIIGYENIISSLNLPDLNDRHVLAAAIRSNSSAIITYNLKDFPTKILKPYNVEALHPDDFISMLIETAAGTVCTIVGNLRRNLKNPPISSGEYLETLFTSNSFIITRIQ